MEPLRKIHIIDSHTCGEPTRVVVSGMPDLGGGSVAEQMQVMKEQFDHYRTAILNEPRGSDVIVGAVLCRPSKSSSKAGVIFFNNAGYLGMCGHGLIGVVSTLQYLGKHNSGQCTIETPVGNVEAKLHRSGGVEFDNVPSFRKAKDVIVQVPELGAVRGDVAWGGNWFFLVKEHAEELTLANVKRLTDVTSSIRKAINEQGYPEVDHVELFGPPFNPENHSRNFVLCPGGVYDRSPCGTGTSAKIACLMADDEMEGEWLQEGILGTRFRCFGQWKDQKKGIIIPSIMGVAFITADTQLIYEPGDPFEWGIGSDYPLTDED